MTFARRIYTKEFRINAAKLVVDEHRPATSVAEELNVSPKTLHSWVKQYREGSLQTAADKYDSVSPEQAETAFLGGDMAKCTPKPVVVTKSTATVEAMYASAVGIDVHADLLFCCYQTFNTTSGETISDHASFGTKQSELSSFSAWVRERNPEIVLMESTGILWLSANEALENVGFTNEQLALVNARDVKAVKGRKTDRVDAERLTQIARFGCFKKSFVPAKVFREMRAISRLYIKSQNDLSRAQNRLHKLLNATGCRARQVFSDLKGVAATIILEAWFDEVEDFEAVVRSKGRRLRASSEEIMDALNFSTSDCLRQTIRLQRENILRLKQFCEKLLGQLKVMQRPYENIISALTTIPGIKETSARLLLSEFSDNMDSFPDSEHFASCLGICPGNNISAGKEHGSGAPKGNKWARTTLTEIAAIAHKVAVSIYSMIKNGEAFRDHDYSEAIRGHCLERLSREIRRTQHQNFLLTDAGIVDAATGGRVFLRPGGFIPFMKKGLWCLTLSYLKRAVRHSDR